MIIVRPSVHEPVGRVLIRILQNGVVRFMLAWTRAARDGDDREDS